MADVDLCHQPACERFILGIIYLYLSFMLLFSHTYKTWCVSETSQVVKYSGNTKRNLVPKPSSSDYRLVRSWSGKELMCHHFTCVRGFVWCNAEQWVNSMHWILKLLFWVLLSFIYGYQKNILINIVILDSKILFSPTLLTLLISSI